MDDVIRYLPDLLEGAKLTVMLTISSALFSVVFAIPVISLRLSPWLLMTVPARIVINVVRGTPLLLQIFFMYFALPQVGLVLSAFMSATIALGVNFGTFMAENFRGAVEDLPRGQIEAAHALGLNNVQVARKIIFPQVLRTMLPTLTGQALTLLQGTALVTVISLKELTYTTQILVNQTFQVFLIFSVAALIYLILSYVISLAGAFAENALRLPGQMPTRRKNLGAWFRRVMGRSRELTNQ